MQQEGTTCQVQIHPVAPVSHQIIGRVVRHHDLRCGTNPCVCLTAAQVIPTEDIEVIAFSELLDQAFPPLGMQVADERHVPLRFPVHRVIPFGVHRLRKPSAVDSRFPVRRIHPIGRENQVKFPELGEICFVPFPPSWNKIEVMGDLHPGLCPPELRRKVMGHRRQHDVIFAARELLAIQRAVAVTADRRPFLQRRRHAPLGVPLAEMSDVPYAHCLRNTNGAERAKSSQTARGKFTASLSTRQGPTDLSQANP